MIPGQTRRATDEDEAEALGGRDAGRLGWDEPRARNPARSVFGELIVLRETAPAGGKPLALPLELTEEVTRAVRGSLLRYVDDPPPEVLSGHAADGSRLERPHVAFLAVPSVCTPGERWVICGVAILLPRDVAPHDRTAIVCALERWQRAGFRLLLGRAGVMQLARGEGCHPALELERWSRPSRRWASVTPVALERNPGDLFARDPLTAATATRRAEEIAARGCAHIGLPWPVRVHVMRRSRFAGAPPASAFAPYPRTRTSGFRRVCVHVELEFAEDVAGPVVLGVGRYFGVGSLARVGRRVGDDDSRPAG
jgi:CRISPR-associated protein Csb2